MPTFNTAELDGIPLAYAVAMAEGRAQKRFTLLDGVTTIAPYQFKRTPGGSNVPLSQARLLIDLDYGHCIWHPHTSHGIGGAIMEREKIDVRYHDDGTCDCFIRPADGNKARGTGPTALIAGMRAYVTSKFGETIEIPEILE